jgi:hypothetical protein
MSRISDNQIQVDNTISSFGQFKVSEQVFLVGTSNEGTTVSTDFWTVTLANGGTTTVANNIATMSTNAAANGSATLESIAKARFIPSTVNVFLAGIRLGDTGTVNNKRRWGAFNATDGLFFELDGTTIKIVSRVGGVDTAITSFNGESSFVLDTDFHQYEIMYNAGRAIFLQDRKRIHTYTPTTISTSGTMDLPIRTENVNSGGLASNVQLFLRGSAIYRYGYGASNFLDVIAIEDPTSGVHLYSRQRIPLADYPKTMVTYTVPANRILAIYNWAMQNDGSITLVTLKVNGIEIDSISFSNSSNTNRIYANFGASSPFIVQGGGVVTVVVESGGNNKQTTINLHGVLLL